jgi:hypothetical protein
MSAIWRSDISPSPDATALGPCLDWIREIRTIGAGIMSRVVSLTPVDSDGQDCEMVDVNLDHVLWMEPQSRGTILLLNDIRAPGAGKSIISSALLVAESAKEVLWAMQDERAEGPVAASCRTS